MMTMPKVLLALALALLSACQTTPESTPLTEPGNWLQDQTYFAATKIRVDALNQWRYSAKVGITTPTVSEVANIVWRFDDQANDVRLFGPLGVGAVTLEFDQYGVVLSDNSGVKHRGDSAQALLTKVVGWPIPIDALSRWLHVLPQQGSVYRYQLNKAGSQVTTLEQLGWHIRYSSYRVYGEGSDAAMLPRKIIASKTLPDRTVLKVKLITKSWVF